MTLDEGTGRTQTELDVHDDGSVVVATLGTLRAEVAKHPFGLVVRSADETILRGSSAAAEDVFDPLARYAAAITYVVDGSIHGGYVATGRRRRSYRLTEVRAVETPDAETLRLEALTDDPLGRVATVTLRFDDEALALDVRLDDGQAVVELCLAATLAPDEDCYGLGERYERANHRGREIVDWVEDACIQPGRGHDWTYWPVPFLLSSRGYGVFADTTARATFRLGSDRDDAWSVGVDGAALSVVLFAGPRPADVVRQFTARTGRPALPPPWALGVWKTTIGGERSILAEAGRLRDEEMGVSAVWLYDQLELETNSGWGSGLGYPTGRYEDVPALIASLHDEGWKVLGYLNPHFIPGRPTFEEGDRRGYFAQREDGGTYLMPGVAADPVEDYIVECPMAMIDFTNPDAVAWWQAMLHRLLTVSGYDGWMEDFGEYLPAEVRLSDGRSGWEARNEYPLLYHRASAEVRATVPKTTATLVRSGHTGSNQHATVAWPGDQHTDWTRDKGLPGVLAAGLSLGLSGMSMWAAEIAGYFDDSDGSGAAGEEELWVRWCELGALTPLMRDHLAQKMETPEPVTVWSSALTRETWRRLAALHNRLFPYLYRHAVAAHETGLPIMRHLVLDYPDDPVARRCEDAYLLGDALLVAPVLERGARSRTAYLPVGGWFRFADDTHYAGGREHTVPAPLGEPPLFVRAGSVLPLLAEAPRDLNAELEQLARLPLELRVYPHLGMDDATYGSALHDGTRFVVAQREGVFEMEVVAGASPRPLMVRLPRGVVARACRVDGVEQSPLADGRVELESGACSVWIELDGPGLRDAAG